MIQRGRHLLVAACDANLLGKRLLEEQLEFYVNEKFYKGCKTTLDRAIIAIRHANSANLVGSNVVKKAICEGLVHPKAVLTISGVPHAQIVEL